MKVTFDPDSLAHMGLTAEEATIQIPDDWASYTPAQRRAWARQMIEQETLELLADIAAPYGRVPTDAEKEEYLAGIQPAIDAAMAGGTR
jgi:hypothetical protein